ncbi:MAG TPA: glycoside hydrolase family 16 protein [Armatimonadota bacterium]|nr:glycoside hydrolase family 16 protein [Armatimonadota bacterium]
MKGFIAVAASAAVLVMVMVVRAQAPPPSADSSSADDAGWKLVWSDEFRKNGAPDPANWGYENGFVRNNEAQWYQPENARCRGGKLIIEAKRERKPNPDYKAGSTDWRTSREAAEYTSASLTTRGKHSWIYGRFEMRAKIDTRPGLWPAFWTVGTEGQWPRGGEIDIMEYYRNMLLANVAWGTDKQWVGKWHTVKRPLAEFNDPNWSKKFHVWRMDWTPESIELYVDGYLMNRTLLKDTVNGDSAHLNPFQHPQYIILNLAVGGNSGGDPSKTKFPSRYVIDYVRVYQKPSYGFSAVPAP